MYTCVFHRNALNNFRSSLYTNFGFSFMGNLCVFVYAQIDSLVCWYEMEVLTSLRLESLHPFIILFISRDQANVYWFGNSYSAYQSQPKPSQVHYHWLPCVNYHISGELYINVNVFCSKNLHVDIHWSIADHFNWFFSC